MGLRILYKDLHEGLNGVKRVAWNIQKINRVSWKREKINRVSWIIFVQITVLFVEGLNGVKRVAWNIQKINRVPCLLHPHWDPLTLQGWFTAYIFPRKNPKQAIVTTRCHEKKFSNDRNAKKKNNKRPLLSVWNAFSGRF